ncbi:MAG TPA: hypothetical protein VMW42_03360 [Desulfatiglandales bacterium]|nr:hypothetical protein [Desulfatiglandales bacterium]
MKLSAQTLIASLIICKVLLGTIFLCRVGVDPLFFENHAIAAEQQEDTEKAPDQNENVANEENIDLDLFLKMKAELKTQEEELATKKKELIAIEEKISEKMNMLTKLRDEIRAQMAVKESVQGEKIKHLIKAYSTMKPQKAATLIEKLEMELAIELLSNMKGDIVGNILSFVDTERAAKISEQLAKRK